MFTLKLVKWFNRYDLYGEYRLNAFKGLFVLIILFGLNVIFKPYNSGYYFVTFGAYTVMAEMLTVNPRKKILSVIIYSTILAFSLVVLGLLSVFPFCYLAFAFIFIAVLYSIVLYKFESFYLAATLIVVLAILLSDGASNNFYVELNNLITMFFSLLVIIVLILVFPKSYYYRIWLRAFFLELQSINHKLELLIDNLANEAPITPHIAPAHIVKMNQYSQLLPKQIYSYSTLRINVALISLLGFIALINTSYVVSKEVVLLKSFHTQLSDFLFAVTNEHVFNFVYNPAFAECRAYRHAYHRFTIIVNSWNRLCLNI